ncbi:hypothetical protein DAI43_17140 [Achromobacter xylosoxidans]|nr:hypothetical protein DAI43_17140 [Achromobacter xylosoxidans]
MTEPLKYCKDCLHFRDTGLSPSPGLCAHPELTQQNVVYGPRGVVAKDARLLDKHCGWDARLFEPKLTIWQRITGKGANR